MSKRKKLLIVLTVFFITIATAYIYHYKKSQDDLSKYYTYKTQYSEDITTFNVKDPVRLNEKANVGLGQEIKLANTDFKIKLTKLFIFDCDSAYKDTGTDYCDWGGENTIYETRYNGKLLEKISEYPYIIQSAGYYTKGYASFTIRPLDYYCQEYRKNGSNAAADKCLASLGSEHKNPEFCKDIIDEDRKTSCEFMSVDSLK